MTDAFLLWDQLFRVRAGPCVENPLRHARILDIGRFDA